ncbi:amidohydrolase family protein [Alicyclobacillus sp. SO9]|uniref:amidohydrolase family protein n=1 Tax=Alicyclobacillus sp. SO9 TaxID=2665646 RepID=UPI0018E8772C|nr:amidohydrolase family protein [Alicyclobacillus sp. SO9]QQE80507.1 amidohydrolase family protein [Alicyclobacillus sp. SO9]
MKTATDRLQSSWNTWDMHAHVIPEEVLASTALREFKMSIDGQVLSLPGDRVIYSNLLDGKWISYQREGLADRLVVSLPPALLRYDLQGDMARQWTELVNAGVERIAQIYNGYLALAYLPMHEVELTLSEIDKRSQSPWAGFVIGTTIGDKHLDDSKLDVIFEALNERHSFLFVHPLKSQDRRLDRYYLQNLLGNPYETGLSMASLILSGKVSRYPQIRFCFSHAGGVTPQILGRWQQGYETRRPGLERLSESPQQAAKRLYVDTVAHNERALELAIEVFGEDHILPGTDSPFPMGESLVKSLHGLPEQQRDTILLNNFPNLLV